MTSSLNPLNPLNPVNPLNPLFVQALQFALAWEGDGYEDVTGDKGGPTRCGITWQDGNRWRVDHGQAALTIGQARATRLSYLTMPVIQEIYFSHYWQPIQGDQLPDPAGRVVFDGAVNSGVGQSVKWLQRTLGVEDDGVVGPNTLAAARAYSARHSAKELCAGMLGRRADFYRMVARKGENQKFLDGWLNRTAALRKAIGVQ